MAKRKFEVCSAGCPCCKEAIKLVQSITCENCDVQILELRSDKAAQGKANAYGVKRVPAVAVNGKLAECCQGAVSVETLREMGVGSPA
ncbi:MAG: thioredoxin family protein [Candidatus Eisenbacteria bacterium]